jgi:hypothetical protein
MKEGRLYLDNSREDLSGDSGRSIDNPGSPEGVSGWQTRLWESLVAFESVQMEHCQAFASDRCDNLMARRAERAKALARLQMDLEGAQNKLLLGEDGDFAERVQAKLSALIDLETTLAEGAHKARKRLRDELEAIRQGRRVLQGYSQYHGSSSRPRLLNSKT